MLKTFVLTLVLGLSTGVLADIADKIAAADSLLSRREYKEAKEFYKQALDKEKQNIDAFRGLSIIALRERDWGDLNKWSDRILKSIPDDLAAQYHKGIAYRESGKFKGLLLRDLDFSKSKKHFEAVIAADSMFSDVLFQRAFLERRKENMSEALAWGNRQIRARPELTEGYIGLIKLYDTVLHISGRKKLETMFEPLDDVIEVYFFAEWCRRDGQYNTADTLFNRIASLEDEILNIPVKLSKLRMALQHNDEETAQQHFDSALASIENDLDAKVFFEHTKYIFTDDELNEYWDLETPADKKEFFRFFWSSRNPTPSAPRNPRALMHFRRMLYCEKNYWDDFIRSPIKAPRQNLGQDYPETYFLNEEFNDRGLIYLRHGEPNDRINTMASNVGVFTETNESWLYFEREDRPEYLFHFLGSHWQLTPYLDNPTMLNDRTGFHPSTTRQANAHSYLDYKSLEHQNLIEGSKAIFGGLSSDFHTWDEDFEAMDTFNYFASFRGKNNKTEVELYTTTALEQLGWSDENMPDTLSFENSGGIYDSTFVEIDRLYETIEIADASNNPRIIDDHFLSRFVFQSDTGAYQIGFYQQRFDAPRIGGENMKIQVPDMQGNQLLLSDLVLAYDVETGNSDSYFSRNDMAIYPNATKSYNLDEPVHLYFEIYNLTRDENGVASFEVESTIAEPGDQKKKFLGLFGGGDKSKIAITDKRSSAETQEVQHMIFDVNRLDDRDYELRVSVRDLNSEEQAEKSIALTLTKQD